MQDKDRRNSLRELNLVDKNIVLYIYIYEGWEVRILDTSFIHLKNGILAIKLLGSLGSSEETIGQCSKTTRDIDTTSPSKTLKH
jgi:hypothetical protein